MPPSWSESPLWRRALRLYGSPGAAAACLRLQDEAGADVPLLLLGCWLAERGATPDEETAATLAACAARWRPVIEGLRGARRALKPLAAGDGSPAARRTELRERIKDAELAAEHELLLEVEALAGSLPGGRLPTRALARANLAALGQGRAAGSPVLEPLLAAAALE
ncbi:TIGR02444 family protein [Marinimicrococcus flavescens]|uniref:TIGR02444 family protein n=1 Tax=Marinimicrococcus flavescens TaxID=3031815 RepID=A0AAP3UYU2_9PROT|nr:TIGR02444 family protein [Marinimicrococcus flavescens]